MLHDINFEIAPGTRVGIAGQTGAGKTTLVNLLTRFYDPVEGQILLDDVDLRDYKLRDLRRQFAIVLQEPVLFSTSLAENIAYARPGASVGEIVAAAQAASAHDFINALPDGYDTQVGERGLRLSGGERQRISLARAFLKDAPILILDEPTSSVDLRTEEAIMQATHRLMEGRTTFIIAHRLSTLERCDVRLVTRSRPDRGHRARASGAQLSSVDMAVTSTTQRLRIVVTGLIAQHPSLGGVAWDYAQYAAGLHRLGHDVYYLEDSGEWPYTLDGGPSGNDWIAHDCTPNVSASCERDGTLRTDGSLGVSVSDQAALVRHVAREAARHTAQRRPAYQCIRIAEAPRRLPIRAETCVHRFRPCLHTNQDRTSSRAPEISEARQRTRRLFQFWRAVVQRRGSHTVHVAADTPANSAFGLVTVWRTAARVHDDHELGELPSGALPRPALRAKGRRVPAVRRAASARCRT